MWAGAPEGTQGGPELNELWTFEEAMISQSAAPPCHTQTVSFRSVVIPNLERNVAASNRIDSISDRIHPGADHIRRSGYRKRKRLRGSHSPISPIEPAVDQ